MLVGARQTVPALLANNTAGSCVGWVGVQEHGNKDGV